MGVYPRSFEEVRRAGVCAGGAWFFGREGGGRRAVGGLECRCWGFRGWRVTGVSGGCREMSTKQDLHVRLWGLLHIQKILWFLDSRLLLFADSIESLSLTMSAHSQL